MNSLIKFSSGGVPEGWLPVEISARYAIVRWMRLGAEPMAEPFFSELVERLRSGNPPAMEFETDLSILVRNQAYIPPLHPRAVIFHMSRCGSTLVLSALRAAGSLVVAPGEPQPLDWAMRMAGSTFEPCYNRGRQVLGSLVTLLAHYQGGQARDVVLKPGIDGIASLPAVYAIWPRVICLILIRDPEQVLASNVEQPPRWLINDCRYPSHSPRDVVEAGLEGMAAWRIGRFCGEVLRYMNERCIVVDYDDLSPDMVRALAARCELPVCSDSDRRIAEVFGTDAKKPARRYLDNRAHKNRRVTESIRRSVERWALEPYLQLQSQRFRIC